MHDCTKMGVVVSLVVHDLQLLLGVTILHGTARDALALTSKGPLSLSPCFEMCAPLCFVWTSELFTPQEAAENFGKAGQEELILARW